MKVLLGRITQQMKKEDDSPLGDGPVLDVTIVGKDLLFETVFAPLDPHRK